MLVELTTEANEESFVIVHQHGGNDVICKSRFQFAAHCSLLTQHVFLLVLTLFIRLFLKRNIFG